MTDAADLPSIAWHSLGNCACAFTNLTRWADALENVAEKLKNGEFVWSTPERMPTNDEYALVFAHLGKRTLSKKRKDHERSDLERYNAIPVIQKHIAQIARVVITSTQVDDGFQAAIDDAQEEKERELEKDSPIPRRVAMAVFTLPKLRCAHNKFSWDKKAHECITEAVLKEDFEAFRDALEKHGIPHPWHLKSNSVPAAPNLTPHPTPNPSPVCARRRKP